MSSVGEWLFAALTLALFVWWMRDAILEGSYQPLGPISADIADLKSSGAAIGHLLNLFMGLSLLPVGKRSSLSAVFGLSWERALAYHRLLGALAVLAILSHVAAELLVWYMQGLLAANLLHYSALNWDTKIWPWVIPMMELFALGVAVAALAACEPVRRRYYYLFYRLHLVLPALVVASLAHSWDSWQYAMPGLLLYALDKLELAFLFLLLSPRPYGSTGGGDGGGMMKLISVRVLGPDVVGVTLHASGGLPPFLPGQTTYLLVPAVSWLQWHPFTVADTGTAHLHSGRVELYIKASGGKTAWTRRLHTLAQHTRGTPHLRAVGPFGGLLDLAAGASRKQVLLAAGVGITPISALASAFLDRAAAAALDTAALNVVEDGDDDEGDEEAPAGARGGMEEPWGLRLLWVSREVQLFAEFAPLLERLLALPNVQVELHLTARLARADSPRPFDPFEPSSPGHTSPSVAADSREEAQTSVHGQLPPVVLACLRSERPDVRRRVPALLEALAMSGDAQERTAHGEVDGLLASPAEPDTGSPLRPWQQQPASPRSSRRTLPSTRLGFVSVFSCGPPPFEAAVRAACGDASACANELTSLNFAL